jgi:PleD family two-component response regulator|tara:strand:+ start:59 stop:238 length:180 start_codon:yes stop_codon:yes gene_type:complete
MKAKEVNKKIDSLTESEWQRMKEHMDKKFPRMAMKDMDSFKLMVQIFGSQMEDKENQLN